MPTSTSTTAAVTKGGGPSLWHRHCPRAWLWAWPPFPCPPPAWPQPRRLTESPRPAAQAAHPPHRARHGRASLLQEEEAHTLTLTLTTHRSPLPSHPHPHPHPIQEEEAQAREGEEGEGEGQEERLGEEDDDARAWGTQTARAVHTAPSDAPGGRWPVPARRPVGLGWVGWVGSVGREDADERRCGRVICSESGLQRLCSVAAASAADSRCTQRVVHGHGGMGAGAPPPALGSGTGRVAERRTDIA